MKVELPDPFRFLFEPHRYKAAYGGRGSGKSHSFAAGLLIDGARQPLRILCGREVQKSIKESVKQLLDDKIVDLGLSSFYDSIQNEIRGKNGTQISFTGVGDKSVDQMKSFEGVDRFWGEESQTFSKHSLEIIRPTIRKPGSEMWFSWNARHPSDPVDLFFRGGSAPASAVVRKVNYDENPYFPDVLEEERLFDEKIYPERYAHVWLGDYEPAAKGAIWNRQTLHDNRVAPDDAPKNFKRIVVGVDHAISDTDFSNEHGIVVCGLGVDGIGYVLDDCSLSGDPLTWAERAIAAYDYYECDTIVIEINQGGDLVKSNLHAIRRDNLHIKEVRASRGKHVRAAPIAALYKMGNIRHVGTFTELEDQLCLMTASGFTGEGSPDRVDALVWAMTDLFPKMTMRSKPLAPPQVNNKYNPHAWRQARA